MARRSNQSTPSSTDPKEPEVTVTTESTEAVQPDAESTESTSTESTSAEASKPATEADLTPFTTAVESAVAERDTATGDLAKQFIEQVVKAYRELPDRKTRNRAQGHLTENLRKAMNSGDIGLARANMTLSDNLTAASPAKVDKAPADPTEAYVARQVALRLAIGLLGNSVPEGVSEDWQTKVKEQVASEQGNLSSYAKWVASTDENKGDEPEVSSVVKAALKAAQGKASGRVAKSGTSAAYTGERRDIGKHITEAFAGVEPGTFLTVAQIRAHKSSEYGDNPPSAGAISARLFPTSGKCTVTGVVPGTNDKSNRGATKA